MGGFFVTWGIHMASKRERQTGKVLAIRLPIELDRDLRAEAQRLKVRPCDLARVALAVGWQVNKAARVATIGAESQTSGGNRWGTMAD